MKKGLINIEMKKATLYFGLACIIGLGTVSCEREYDSPPVAVIPEGNVKTITELKGMFTGTDLSIQEDLSVYGVITTDQSTGNFYKEAYFQDATDAINLRFLSSSSLSIGDSVRLYLKGTVLTQFNGVFQLDSVDVDKNVIIQQNDVHVEPLVLDLSQASTGLGKLVKFENVEFVAGELGSTWADAANKYSVNHNLTNCNGTSTLIVRTSGYANFANDVIPQGNGDIIGIVGQFGSDIQVYIRNPNELTLSGNRCTGGGSVTCDPVGSVNESFESHPASSPVSNQCWATQATVGSIQWMISGGIGSQKAQGGILGTSDASNEMWMVSPEVTATGSNTLTFESAVQNWNHDGLGVYYSTDYSGNAGSATWTPLTATFAGTGSGNGIMISSGSISLSAVSTGTFRIGFKYNGSGSGGQTSTYYVDNVVIN